MSKFRDYAAQVNTIAKEAFAEYQKAQAELADAESRVKKYPSDTRGRIVDDEYIEKMHRAAVDKSRAQKRFEAARKNVENQKLEISALRKKLSAEVYDHFAADPAALDGNTMELLKAGIMKPDEYSRLLNAAQKNGNYTMMRMVGKYANDAAEAAEKNGDRDSAVAFRGVAHFGQQTGSKEVMEAFDALSEIYDRTNENPAMMGKWDELTGPIIANF